MTPQTFVTVSFQCQRDLVEKFRKLHSRYGDTSQILRLLLKSYVDGKIAIPPRSTK